MWLHLSDSTHLNFDQLHNFVFYLTTIDADYCKNIIIMKKQALHTSINGDISYENL